MNKFTSADYIKAVKMAIEKAKSGPDAGLWLNASPAQLRNWCQQVYWTLERESDRRQFELFFQLSRVAGKSDRIDSAFRQFQLGKLKAVRNFIRGSSEKPNPTIVELLAVLADFENRPYSNFRKVGGGSAVALAIAPIAPIAPAAVSEEEVVVGDDWEGKEEVFLEALDHKEEGVDEGQSTTAEANRGAAVEEPLLLKADWNRSLGSKNWMINALILSVVLVGGMVIYKYGVEEPSCMFWKDNHYEVIDCNSRALGFASYRKLVPVQEHLLRHFQKLEVGAETVFFKNGKAIIWYGKNDQGVYEYFSYGGEHPETGKHLKPVTRYHVNKYILAAE
ncbi:hypothetical protein [Flavobacterium sp. JP2137]|uniref:hypothetical protein n=1 Tax=Flavobacterium sp. JP2137 TaxID=3414510 RepID=UPI003D2FDBAF